eukprot:5675404-Pleurochrysis_carterae.AAC.1
MSPASTNEIKPRRHPVAKDVHLQTQSSVIEGVQNAKDAKRRVERLVVRVRQAAPFTLALSRARLTQRV